MAGTFPCPFPLGLVVTMGPTLDRLCHEVLGNNLSEAIFGRLLQTTTWQLLWVVFMTVQQYPRNLAELTLMKMHGALFNLIASTEGLCGRWYGKWFAYR